MLELWRSVSWSLWVGNCPGLALKCTCSVKMNLGEPGGSANVSCLALFGTARGTATVAYTNRGMQGVSSRERTAEHDGGWTEKAVARISSPASLLITQPKPKNIHDRGYCKSQQRYSTHKLRERNKPKCLCYQPPVCASYLKTDLNAIHDIINGAFTFHFSFARLYFEASLPVKH